MDQVTYARRTRAANRLLMILFMVAMVVGLGVLMGALLHSAGQIKDQPDVRRLLIRLAWTSLVLMLGAMVFLTWAIVHLIRDRLRPEPRPPSAKRVNAWEEAGRRYELDESDTQSPPDEPASE